MNGYDIQKWNRCLEIAEPRGVEIEIKEGFFLRDRDGFSLGSFGTVAEVYSFLCGYEHACKPNERSQTR